MKDFKVILVIALASLLGSAVRAITRLVQTTHCNREVGLSGCYNKLGGTQLNDLVYNGRLTIDWQHYTESLNEIICTCVGIAEAGGYKVIGLQYYGECWGAKENVTSSYNHDGQCWTGDGNSSIKTCSIFDAICAGDGDSTFVYQLYDF